MTRIKLWNTCRYRISIRTCQCDRELKWVMLEESKASVVI